MKRWLILVGVTALILAAMVPVRAAAQTNENWGCVAVNGEMTLNIRSGAGVNYPVIAQRNPGEQLEADYSQSQAADGYTWVPVRYTGGRGWAVTVRLDACEAASPPPVPTSGDQAVQNQVNQDGVLDRFEIAEIARSVVLVADVQRGRIKATGTGTIITPDGLIVTNEHVIDGADRIAIALLNNINDPPDYQYEAEVVQQDKDIDVALLAIRYDLDGKPVNTAALNLPFIPSTLKADDVFRGDTVYIFGYPGIGDDYLVVTSGTIVSVENGTVSGQRIPIWYRTDAEIAPGNSGGLVVNGDGEFVGIPTFVQTEQETGARLGGIRPAEVALNAVSDARLSNNTTTPAPPPVSPSTSPPAESASVVFGSVQAEHGAVVDGLPGIQFHVAFSITGWEGRNATVSARFYTDDLASAPLVNADGPSRYHDKNDAVITSVAIVPCCAQAVYDDLPLFIPYEALGLTQPGTYPLKVHFEVTSVDNSWHYTLSWEFITYTRG
jgi:S1-C subfamily serine protease